MINNRAAGSNMVHSLLVSSGTTQGPPKRNKRNKNVQMYTSREIQTYIYTRSNHHSYAITHPLVGHAPARSTKPSTLLYIITWMHMRRTTCGAPHAAHHRVGSQASVGVNPRPQLDTTSPENATKPRQRVAVGKYRNRR